MLRAAKQKDEDLRMRGLERRGSGPRPAPAPAEPPSSAAAPALEPGWNMVEPSHTDKADETDPPGTPVDSHATAATRLAEAFSEGEVAELLPPTHSLPIFLFQDSDR